MGEDDPAAELARAQQLLEGSDAKHAAHHLAGAMALGPTVEVERAIARLLGLGGPNVLELVPLGEGVYWGTAILRAALLVRLGRGGEGVPLVLMAQAAVPKEPVLQWADKWIEDEKIAVAIDLPPVLSAALRCAASLPLPTLAFLQKLAEAREPNDMLAMVSAKIAREQGRFEEAMAIARKGHERSPSWNTALAIAGVHRAQGEIDEAIQWYRDAAARGMVAARLDEGDLLLSAGSYDEAIVAYDAVPAHDEEYDWALPSSLFARAFGKGDAAAESQLVALDSRRARQLRVHLEPYLHSLPPPQAALVNMARALDPQNAPVSAAVSSLEPPSAVLVLRWTMRRAGQNAHVEVAFSQIPEPDPRESSSKDAVWTYRKAGVFGRLSALTQEARPAVPAPPDEARAEVAQLAASPFQLDRWAQAARGFRSPPAELRAVMVHPPEPPEQAPVWDWLFRVQVAAALSLAWQDGLDPLLEGPVDWTTTAAIIALTQRAREEPTLRAQTLARLQPYLDEPAGPVYYECVFLPALRCARYLDPPEELRERLARLRREADPLP